MGFIKPSSLSFNAKVVTPAQKTSVASSDPQLIAASTAGKFTLTGAASLVLGVVPGDSLAFADNLTEILQAIAAKAPEVVACFKENGLDIESVDDCEVFVKEMREVFIFKGYALLNADGTPKMVNARTSKEEKLAMYEENKDEVLAQFAAAGIENPTEEQILAAIPSKQEAGVYGSKLSTVSDMTGYGLTLSTTDTNIWTSLKRDIAPELRDRVKRVYKVDVKNPRVETLNNGYEDIQVTVYPVIDATDEEVTARKGFKAADETENNSAE